MSVIECYRAGRLWRVRGHLMTAYGFIRNTGHQDPFGVNDRQYHGWKRGWWAAHWWLCTLKK